jgi:hypothetical protein
MVGAFEILLQGAFEQSGDLIGSDPTLQSLKLRSVLVEGRPLRRSHLSLRG